MLWMKQLMHSTKHLSQPGSASLQFRVTLALKHPQNPRHVANKPAYTFCLSPGISSERPEVLNSNLVPLSTEESECPAKRSVNFFKKSSWESCSRKRRQTLTNTFENMFALAIKTKPTFLVSFSFFSVFKHPILCVFSIPSPSKVLARVWPQSNR